jgi:hypothetical protein
VTGNVTAPAAGMWDSLFMKKDGTLWATGYNLYGELGTGTLTSTNLPARVTGMSLANIISGSMAESTLAVGLSLTPQNFSASLAGNASPGGNGVQLQFSGAPDYPYVLLGTTNLLPPVVWQPVLTNSTDSKGNWSYTDPNAATTPARFFRIMAP